MSAKLLQALTDEHPDLQKQIGCLAGISQLFDRHHTITGKRINGHSRKRLPSVHSHFSNGNLGTEANACSPQTVINQNQNQRVSAESLKTASSSSCSSYSSLDYIKSAQPEPPSFDQSSFSEQFSKTKQKFPLSDSDDRSNLSISCNKQSKSSSAQPRQQSLDFRVVVKDSIYRKTHRSLVKTQPGDDLPKLRDSPRTLQSPKSVGEAAKIGVNGTSRIPVDLNESLRVLAKLKEAPWHFSESRDPPRSSYESRDGAFLSGTKDASRFSFDGQEIRKQSFDSRDVGKSFGKLRELPRLSLDSREYSSKGSNFDLKSNSVLKDLESNLKQKISKNGVPNLQPEPRSNPKPPSVVARLMGLEAMPNSEPDEDFNSSNGEKNNDCPISCLPKSSFKDSVSPRLGNPNSVMKPICNSRFPIEPAPWRQQESGQNPQKMRFRAQESHVKPPASQFVYSEIKKRLKDLEFQRSDKDLRALKQLLDAMEAKGLLADNNQEEDQASKFPLERNSQNQNQIWINQRVRLANKQNPQIYHPISAPLKGNCSPRAFESSIVIMKPAKFINKSTISAVSVIPVDGLSVLRRSKLVEEHQTGNPRDSKKVSSNSRVARDSTPKINHRAPVNRVLDSKTNGRIEENSLRKPRPWSNQASHRPQQITKESTTASIKISGSLGPRLQHKKVESEKQTRVLPALPDSGKPRRQSEVGSPGRKIRSSSNLIDYSQTENQLSQISNETRSLSCQGDEISLQSDSNVSLGSQIVIEVTHIHRSEELDHASVQHDETVLALKHKKSSFNWSGDSSSSVNSTVVSPDQPSPVSVIDPSFYRDDLMPSPVTKNPVPFKDDDRSVEDSQNLAEFNVVINQKKIEIESLAQKLKQLGLANDTSKAAIEPLMLQCEAMNPDHQYVCEILLASGFLLQDFGSDLFPIRLQPSSEWAPQSKYNPEKCRRRLVFDIVNEILNEKLEPVVSQCEPWVQANKLAWRIPTGQWLPRELCREIDRLGTYSSACDDGWWLGNWADFSGEISTVVLGIERLIFKDLVDEILRGEVWNHRAKPSRPRRQLFVK